MPCPNVTGCGDEMLWCPTQREGCEDREKPGSLVIMFVCACSITAIVILACYLLNRNERGKAWLRDIALTGVLEAIVVCAIMINTIALAIQNPGNTFSDDFNDFLDGLDIVLTTTFTIEMLIKIGAFGLSADALKDYDAVYPNEVVEVYADNLDVVHAYEKYQQAELQMDGQKKQEEMEGYYLEGYKQELRSTKLLMAEMPKLEKLGQRGSTTLSKALKHDTHASIEEMEGTMFSSQDGDAYADALESTHAMFEHVDRIAKMLADETDGSFEAFQRMKDALVALQDPENIDSDTDVQARAMVKASNQLMPFLVSKEEDLDNAVTGKGKALKQATAALGDATKDTAEKKAAWNQVRDPATRTILQQDGPNHLGLWYNALRAASNGPNHLGAVCPSDGGGLREGEGRGDRRTARGAGRQREHDEDPDLGQQPVP